MKIKVNTFLMVFMIAIFTQALLAQSESIEIEGAIQIGHADDMNTDKGTIRFNPVTHDFEGWNGFFWISLTGFKTGSVIDSDSNIYRTVKIGGQEWMVDNLKTTTYQNGDSIDYLPGSADWAMADSGAYSFYNNDSLDGVIYGHLYNWFTVIDDRGLCPTGWHIPNNVEWDSLIVSAGGSVTGGNRLKEIGGQLWDGDNIDATNETAFTARLGGYRSFDGVSLGKGLFAFWWSLTGLNADRSWWFGLSSMDGASTLGVDDKNEGLSIRCVKD